MPFSRRCFFVQLSSSLPVKGSAQTLLPCHGLAELRSIWLLPAMMSCALVDSLSLLLCYPWQLSLGPVLTHQILRASNSAFSRHRRLSYPALHSSSLLMPRETRAYSAVWTGPYSCSLRSLASTYYAACQLFETLMSHCRGVVAPDLKLME